VAAVKVKLGKDFEECLVVVELLEAERRFPTFFQQLEHGE
jgi:hypothetical protein